MVLISQSWKRQAVLSVRSDLQKSPSDSVPYISLRQSLSLNQLQTNSSLAIAEEQAFVGKDGVVPGFVDLHSVVRDERDVDAALRGGFTTVVGVPLAPVHRSERLTVLTAGPLTRELKGEELGEVGNDAVCLSQGFSPLVKSGVLRRALQYSASGGKLVLLHAEDPSLTGAGVLGEGLIQKMCFVGFAPQNQRKTINNSGGGIFDAAAAIIA